MANAIVEAAKKRREKLFSDYRQRQTQQEQQKAKQPGMRFDEKRGKAYVIPGSVADPQRPSRASALDPRPVAPKGPVDLVKGLDPRDMAGPATGRTTDYIGTQKPLTIDDLATPQGQRMAFNRELEGILGPTLQTLQQQVQSGTQLGQSAIERLQGQEQARLSELESLREERLSALEEATVSQLDKAQREAAMASEDVAKRFGFSGFGRSTEQVGAQDQLAEEANRINAEIRNQAALQKQLILAETSGASDEILESIRDQISVNQQNLDALQADFNQRAAELRLGAIEAGQAGVGALQERLQAAAEAEAALAEADTDLSEQLGYLVNSRGEALLSDSGEPINLKEALEAKKFISATKYQGSGVFDPNTGEFISMGGGRAGLIGGDGTQGAGAVDPFVEQLINLTFSNQLSPDEALERIDGVASTSKNRKENLTAQYLQGISQDLSYGQPAGIATALTAGGMPTAPRTTIPAPISRLGVDEFEQALSSIPQYIEDESVGWRDTRAGARKKAKQMMLESFPTRAKEIESYFNLIQE